MHIICAIFYSATFGCYTKQKLILKAGLSNDFNTVN